MKNQNPIHVFATWKVKEGSVESVLALLETVSSESVKEPGNLFYTIHQSIADTNTIVLFEGYENEAAIDEHRDSAHYKDLVVGKILPLLDSRAVVLTKPFGV